MRSLVQHAKLILAAPIDDMQDTLKRSFSKNNLRLNTLASTLLLVVTLSTAAVTWTFREVLLVTDHQFLLESRHPLARRRQRRSLRLLESLSQQEPESTYLAFGATGPEGTSYPYLLDANAVTIGVPATTTFAPAAPAATANSTTMRGGNTNSYADLAAACTQTVVGDAFNVNMITIEYEPLPFGAGFTTSHGILVQRLQRRFPQAVIVLVQQVVEPLAQILLTMPYNRTQTLVEWRIKNTSAASVGANSMDSQTRTTTSSTSTTATPPPAATAADNALRLASAMVQASEDSEGELRWRFFPPEKDARIQALLQAQAADSNNNNKSLQPPLVQHYELLMQQLAPPQDLYNVQQLSQWLQLFTEDGTALSPAGHVRVAHDVRALVNAAAAKVDDISGGGAKAAPSANWGSGDDCHIWFGTGDYNLESNGATRVNLAVDNASSNHVSPQHKHALEFARDAAASVQIHNPFDQDRMLSLTYLTDADSMSYPRTRVVLNGVPSVLLHPFHDTTDDDVVVLGGEQQAMSSSSSSSAAAQAAHQASSSSSSSRYVARTSSVGYVPPGPTTVSLDPLQSTKLPFRLLGASLLAQEVSELQSIEFALETDTLPVSSAENDDDDEGDDNAVMSRLFLR